MINIKSNIDNFIKQFKDKANKISSSIQETPKIIVQQMIEEMKSIIERERSVWTSVSSPLEYVSGDDFTIEQTSNSCVVYIGRNTNKIVAKDGARINPYFFIEFGFGIRGEKNPKTNHDLYGWKYNINKHERSWFYVGYDGEKHWTVGKEGTNFMYTTIQKYKNKWQEIVMKNIKGAIN